MINRKKIKKELFHEEINLSNNLQREEQVPSNRKQSIRFKPYISTRRVKKNRYPKRLVVYY